MKGIEAHLLLFIGLITNITDVTTLIFQKIAFEALLGEKFPKLCFDDIIFRSIFVGLPDIFLTLNLNSPEFPSLFSKHNEFSVHHDAFTYELNPF